MRTSKTTHGFNAKGTSPNTSSNEGNKTHSAPLESLQRKYNWPSIHKPASLVEQNETIAHTLVKSAPTSYQPLPEAPTASPHDTFSSSFFELYEEHTKNSSTVQPNKQKNNNTYATNSKNPNFCNFIPMQPDEIQYTDETDLLGNNNARGDTNLIKIYD